MLSPSKRRGRHGSTIKVGVESTDIRNGKTPSLSIFHVEIARRFRWCHCSPLLCVPRHFAWVIFQFGIDHSWIRYVRGAPEGNSGNAGYSSAIHSVLAISGTLRGQACFGCEFRAGKKRAMTCNAIPTYSTRAKRGKSPSTEI